MQSTEGHVHGSLKASVQSIEMPGNDFTFSLPLIPVQSIPIPSHSHSRTLHRCSINYFWAREDSSLNMPLKLTISCVHFFSTETRKIVVENIISFYL